ncbi:MAG: metal ABC transporter permease [Verrucomicrobia bacterium]|nr:metal ABC transporter permease [Verrucomicrobiota bacterium]
MIDTLADLFRSFPHPVLAGVLTAAVCAALGVFVILKRVVFIGIALSETAACGIAAAWVLHLPPMAGAMAATLTAVLLLAGPFESRRIPRDAMLGVVFVAASSLALLLVSGSGFGLQEIRALLYGDLILAGRSDTIILAAVLLPCAAALALFGRPVLYAFLDREAATVLRVRPAVWEAAFFLLLGTVEAAAAQTAGTLLVFCHLVVPSSMALLLSRRLSVVIAIAVGSAVVSTLTGLAVSYRHDLPTNQTICAVSVALLAAGAIARSLAAFIRGHHRVL